LKDVIGHSSSCFVAESCCKPVINSRASRKPFNLDARKYGVYERDLDERDLDERDFDIDSLEDLLEREDFDLWERSPNDEDNFLYARAPTDAYKKLIALNPKMQAGKSYAFEMEFPLTDKEKKPPAKETADQKRLREMQIKLLS